jgi:hypothetical protein
VIVSTCKRKGKNCCENRNMVKKKAQEAKRSEGRGEFVGERACEGGGTAGKISWPTRGLWAWTLGAWPMIWRRYWAISLRISVSEERLKRSERLTKYE